MKEKQIIEALKTGNFSIIYTDNGSCTIYEGKVSTNTNWEKKNPKEIVSIDCDSYGYLPKEVELLVKALGGNSDSF